MSRSKTIIQLCEEQYKVGDWIYVSPDYNPVDGRYDSKRKWKILAFRGEEVQLNDPEMSWFPLSAISKMGW